MNFTYKIAFWVGVLSLTLLPLTALAGGGPENVLLVVNAESDSSKMIANWYIDGRGIPARNVFYLNGITMRERTSIEVFTEKILKPIMAEIKERQLSGIDYVVYSSDFPTAITIAPHRSELLKLNKNLPAKLFLPEASINSLTYFAVPVFNDSPSYMSLDANNYYRHQASLILRRPFFNARQAEFQDAIKVFNTGTPAVLQESIDTLTELSNKNPNQVALSYWIAKFCAKRGDSKLAARWLQRAIQTGWRYKQVTLKDPAFATALEDPLFKGFAERIPDDPFDFVPTRGFKSNYGFGANGFPNDEAGQGNRHFLSTVLAVTRNFGNTEVEALRQLKKTMVADESQPTGTFYFSDNGDVRSNTRKRNFAAAITALESLGHKTQIVKTNLPQKAGDIIGLTCGKSYFSFAKSGSRIVPGAICENLTSWGGVMARKGHSGISELIRSGTAGSSGTVVEPYALQAKFPHPMIHAHYARGCSLAESFYQSVQGPFQLLIVGDALCQPWAVKPKIEIKGLSAGEKISGKRELKVDISKSPVPVQKMELYVDGKLVVRSGYKETIKFDSTKMTDGYHEVRVVVVASGLIETVGNCVIPFQVDNFGKATTLTAERTDYRISRRITFDAKSNFGTAIELFHNNRSLGKKDGRDVEFTVSASKLGRGPVKLIAVALSDQGNKVASMPLEFEISGVLSKTKVMTEPQPKPKPLKLPTAK